MARRPRLHVPGGFYHVTLRGNHQQPIFFCDDDRALLERIVADSIARVCARIHAYCWMTNHIHLLVQVSDQPLGKLMLRIASSYARVVQLRLDTTGHLFERRYHASLVDTDRYLLAVLRYIHCNPVEGGLVCDPALYRWSSHRAYLGRDHKEWLTTSFVSRALAADPDCAANAYRELMNSVLESLPPYPPPMPPSSQPAIAGDDAFMRRTLARAPPRLPARSLEELVEDCCLRFDVTQHQLIARGRARNLVEARAWLGHHAVSEGIASVSAVARLLERSEGALRHAIARCQAEGVVA